MGIIGFWKILQKTKFPKTTVHVPPGKLLPRGHLYHVDFLGTLYPEVFDAYRNAKLSIANEIIESHLVQRGFRKDSTAIYIDGPPPAEKILARELRKKGDFKALSNVAALLHTSRKVDKPEHTTCNKDPHGRYPFQERSESISRHLAGQGWGAILCPSEADIAIGGACGKEDIVITRDSDAFAYANINTIWRPQDDHYLVYHVPKVLQHLGLSRVGLTSLAVTCLNDYTKNVLCIMSNLEILQSLEKNEQFADANAMVKAYMNYLSANGREVSKGHFNPALDIFVRLRFTPSVPNTPCARGSKPREP